MKNVNKEEIIRVRQYAKNIREWAGALGITHNTLYKYCKLYNIPTDLSLNYIPPPAPVTERKSLPSSSSMATENKTQWDDKLIGAQSEYIPPSKLYVVGPNLPPNTKAMPSSPYNPMFRSPRNR